MLRLGFKSESSHPIYPIHNGHLHKIHFLRFTHSEQLKQAMVYSFVFLHMPNIIITIIIIIFVMKPVIVKSFYSYTVCCFISGNFDAVLMSTFGCVEAYCIV